MGDAPKRTINVAITINAIENLDESTQSFQATLFLQLFWEHDEAEEFTGPWMDWRNGKVTVSEKRYRPGKAKGDKDRLTMMVTGTFTSEMNLQTFPVDDQKLSIVLVAGDDIEFKPMEGRDSVGVWLLERGNPLLQWQPVLEKGSSDKGIVDARLTLTDPKHSASGGVYAQAEFSAYVYRKSQAWMWNVMAPAAMLSTAILIHFGLDVRDVASRVKVDFAIIFTVIGLKFVVASRLPLVPYLTILDWYLLLCQAMCIFVSVQAAIMKVVLLTLCDGEYLLTGGTVDGLFECAVLHKADLACAALDVLLFLLLHGRYMLVLRSRIYQLEHGDFIDKRHLFGSGQTLEDSSISSSLLSTLPTMSSATEEGSLVTEGEKSPLLPKAAAENATAE